MSGPRRLFDPAELSVPGEPEPTVAELADALAAARALEALTGDAGIHPTEGFADRVMAAIADEPAPRLVVRPAAAVRYGSLGTFLASIRDAWGVATTGGRPIGVRAQALAFVLLVVLAASALTTATAVTVGALLGPDGSTAGPDRSSPPSAPAGPLVSPTPLESTDSDEPSESPEPSESAEAPESAEPNETAEPTATTGPTKTAKPTVTPRATRTPRPTETAEPDETPEPTEPTETPEGSDDHGGGSGHG